MVSSTLPFAPGLTYPTPGTRIVTLFLGFSVCFVILSISVEGLFYLAYTANLLIWAKVEGIVRQQSKPNFKGEDQPQTKGYQLQMDDLRIAVFFLFFVQVGFFGTGKYVLPCSIRHDTSNEYAV